MTISNRAGHRKVPGPVSFVDGERAMKKVPSTKFGVSEWPQVFNLRSATLVAVPVQVENLHPLRKTCARCAMRAAGHSSPGSPHMSLKNGHDQKSRGDTIRTCDLYVPNVAL